MSNIIKDIEFLLASKAFQTLTSCNLIKIEQLNAAIAILITLGIPFDVEFSPGTRREAAAAQLTIYINPTTTIQFVLAFEAGGNIFGGTVLP